MERTGEEFFFSRTHARLVSQPTCGELVRPLDREGEFDRGRADSMAGSVKFLPIIFLGLALPRAIAGAIAVAIWRKWDTQQYEQNIANLVKAGTD